MKKAFLGMFLLATTSFAAAPAASSSGGYAGQELLFGANRMTFNLLPGQTPVVDFAVTVGYQRQMFMPNMQVGLRGAFNTQGATIGASSWNANAWGTYNFDSKLEEAVFLGVGVGLQQGTAPGYNMNVAISAEIGKRCEVVKGLVYRPTIQAVKVLNGGNFAFAFNLVSFAAMW